MAGNVTTWKSTPGKAMLSTWSQAVSGNLSAPSSASCSQSFTASAPGSNTTDWPSIGDHHFLLSSAYQICLVILDSSLRARCSRTQLSGLDPTRRMSVVYECDMVGRERESCQTAVDHSWIYCHLCVLKVRSPWSLLTPPTSIKPRRLSLVSAQLPQHL